ncbi:MAG: hypothetical protein L6N95_02535 [Candidatus Methylarchaceae archaeon HK01B]|nr:hypothetical protein [Candidatus Methylarchaceae archaeon HK01M]MCP8318690.1 hypothetical protein [Candidatus Methylarchaceae archaeon HK01B]
MRKRHVDAISLKSGPTESGGIPQRPPIEPSTPVGGELLPAVSQYWLLILLLLLPLGFLLYKKRSTLFPWILKLIRL